MLINQTTEDDKKIGHVYIKYVHIYSTLGVWDFFKCLDVPMF